MMSKPSQAQLFSPRAGMRGMDELQFAAYCGSLEVVKVLLGAGADVAASDDFGCTALHWNLRMACAPGDRFGVAEALLNAGADVNHRDGEGNSVLDAAEAATAPPRLLALLRSRGAR